MRTLKQSREKEMGPQTEQKETKYRGLARKGREGKAMIMQIGRWKDDEDNGL